MANEEKLIPILGWECSRIINPFVLRLLVLLYYAGLILSIPVWYNESRTERNFQYLGMFLFIWGVGYWVAVYLVAYLLTWLFTGKPPKGK